MLNKFSELLKSDFSSFDEAEFNKSHHNPVEIRKIVLFGIIVFCSYLFLDYFLFPEYIGTIALIRIGFFLPAALFLFFLTYSRFYHRFSIIIFFGISIFSAAGVIYIEYLVRSSEYAGMYFYGIAQVLLVFYGTGKTKFLSSLICGLCIVIPAIIVDTVFVETDVRRIATKSLFMFTMLLLGLVASSIIQRTARDRFLSHRRVEELSMTDTLTGLKNRLYYQKTIIDEILQYININIDKRQGRKDRLFDNSQDESYALIMLDIDFFKRINDVYGHEAGDEVLKEFSARVVKIIRAEDVLIRWGGEEFLLLLRHTRMEYIELLVNRIRKEISEKVFDIGDESEAITVSGGIYIIYPNSCHGVSTTVDLFNLADKALYFSKENGRNCFTQVKAEGSGLNRKETFSAFSDITIR